MFPIQSTTDDSKLYVDDVFSTYLYTGNGSTQTINNGIDLAGKGGMVWIKYRNSPKSHALFDTARTSGYVLTSNTTNVQVDETDGFTSFNSTGFTLGSDSALQRVNNSGGAFVSWTFRKAPKFFDVVTFTSNATKGATFNHSLGVSPGMVIIKSTGVVESWWAWHRSLATNQFLALNLTDVATTATPTITATSSSITLSDNWVSAASAAYVAHLFAHDTNTDGIIQCGSVTTDASGNATVNLGWEPQFLLVKSTNNANNWVVVDSMRGWPNGSSLSDVVPLYPNTSGSEPTLSGGSGFYPTSTGFKFYAAFGGPAASSSNIYLAIRRPNKPPTTGMQVYTPQVWTNTNTTSDITGAGFPPDLVFGKRRGTAAATNFADRLRGGSVTLYSSNTNAETGGDITGFLQDGISVRAWDGSFNGATGTTSINFLRRAPGFFDVVCMTATGTTNTAVNHGLGAVPELIVIKRRNSSGYWGVYHSAAGNNNYLYLNTTQAATAETGVWPTGSTSSVVRINESTFGLASGATYVAHLFATLLGISKVGSYTGNGSSQTINCGFTTGARFVLIKRTDSTGDWYVWDSARGIVSANDPHLSLNTTAAEVTTDDSVDPDNSGFIVNQNTATNINVTSASYIFLSIA